MAISVDVSSSASGKEVSSLTWAHTNTGATNIMAIQCCNDSSLTVSSVEYPNGTAVTGEVAAASANGSTRVHHYYDIAPATGNNNVDVVFSGSGFVFAGATTFIGADQTSPVDVTSLAYYPATFLRNGTLVGQEPFRKNVAG